MAGTRKEGILQVNTGGGAGAAVDIVTPLGPNVAADSVSVTIATDEVPIDVNINEDNTTASGTIFAFNDIISITPPDGYNSVSVDYITAFFTGVIGFYLGPVGNRTLIKAYDTRNSDWRSQLTDAAVDNRYVIPNVAGMEVSVLCTTYTVGGVTITLTASKTAVPDSTSDVNYGQAITGSEKLVPIGAENEAATWLPLFTRTSAPSSLNRGLITRQVGLPAAATLADNTSNPSLTQIASFGMMFDGSTWDRVRGDSTNGLLVNLGANNAVTVAGVATEVTLAAVETAIISQASDLDNMATSMSAVESVLAKAGTSVQTTVADNAASVTILVANAARQGATILNTSSATLRARLNSAAATLTNYTVALVTGAYYEIPFKYTGAITGIWDTDPNDGAALVTELTA